MHILVVCVHAQAWTYVGVSVMTRAYFYVFVSAGELFPSNTLPLILPPLLKPWKMNGKIVVCNHNHLMLQVKLLLAEIWGQAKGKKDHTRLYIIPKNLVLSCICNVCVCVRVHMSRHNYVFFCLVISFYLFIYFCCSSETETQSQGADADDSLIIPDRKMKKQMKRQKKRRKAAEAKALNLLPLSR